MTKYNLCVTHNDRLCRITTCKTPQGANLMLEILRRVYTKYDFEISEKSVRTDLADMDSELQQDLRHVLLNPYEYRGTESRFVVIDGGV
jgi:hypothetical protein